MGAHSGDPTARVGSGARSGGSQCHLGFGLAPGAVPAGSSTPAPREAMPGTHTAKTPHCEPHCHPHTVEVGSGARSGATHCQSWQWGSQCGSQWGVSGWELSPSASSGWQWGAVGDGRSGHDNVMEPRTLECLPEFQWYIFVHRWKALVDARLKGQ